MYPTSVPYPSVDILELLVLGPVLKFNPFAVTTFVDLTEVSLLSLLLPRLFIAT